ncbi:histidine--tRNA ligase [Candidatus Woesearchaeota archaeon]|jgi:histidyl-tRNA synthetase|nr:histidine--tRNA ligase [Candidatus Woesearchaeota archaeon]MAG92014.1 histidine--tRNA ligase [Candidatus Woesearchaeota archaeon]
MDLQLPKGTRDIAPEEKIAKDKIVNTLKEVFELYGYAPLETPLLEKYDVLSSKYAGGNEILKETFRLKDQGDRELGLRYDLTVPMCRFVGMNPAMKMPFKRYQIGEVFRDGPVGSSRYRQFTQCDVDVVGSSSMSADAEIMALIYSAFKKLNLDVVIKVNNRKLLNDVLDYCGIEKNKQEAVILSIDKLEKMGIDVVKGELKKQDIDDKTIGKIIDILNIKGNNEEKIAQIKNMIKESEGLEEIQQLLKFLKNINFEADFDVSLARGLSYYTGTVAETFIKNSNVKSSVCAGGRYDNMIGAFLGKGNFPAVGVSFGVDRIYDAIKQKNKQKTNTKIYVIPIKTLDESMKIAQKLRDAGINTDIDSMDRGPSKNLEFANSLGIPYVVFVGKKELEDNKLKLRDMKSGKEELMSIDDVIKKLKS